MLIQTFSSKPSSRLPKSQTLDTSTNSSISWRTQQVSVTSARLLLCQHTSTTMSLTQRNSMQQRRLWSKSTKSVTPIPMAQSSQLPSRCSRRNYGISCYSLALRVCVCARALSSRSWCSNHPVVSMALLQWISTNLLDPDFYTSSYYVMRSPILIHLLRLVCQ
jgi:hypothetical protein